MRSRVSLSSMQSTVLGWSGAIVARPLVTSQGWLDKHGPPGLAGTDSFRPCPYGRCPTGVRALAIPAWSDVRRARGPLRDTLRNMADTPKVPDRDWTAKRRF